jgi:hypothetical protein
LILSQLPFLSTRHFLHLRIESKFQYPDGENADIERILDRTSLALSGILPDTPIGNYSQSLSNNRYYAERLMKDDRFGLTAAWDGLLLFRKQNTDNLQQHAEPICERAVDPLAVFEDSIALVDFHMKAEDRRLQLQFDWIALSHLNDEPAKLAISRLEDVNVSRIVHLPSYILWPTTHWVPGCGVRESFWVDVPDSVAPGTYNLMVGWYDTLDPQAYATDDRSRIGQEIVLAEFTID